MNKKVLTVATLASVVGAFALTEMNDSLRDNAPMPVVLEAEDVVPEQVPEDIPSVIVPVVEPVPEALPVVPPVSPVPVVPIVPPQETYAQMVARLTNEFDVIEKCEPVNNNVYTLRFRKVIGVDTQGVAEADVYEFLSGVRKSKKLRVTYETVEEDFTGVLVAPGDLELTTDVLASGNDYLFSGVHLKNGVFCLNDGRPIDFEETIDILLGQAAYKEALKNPPQKVVVTDSPVIKDVVQPVAVQPKVQREKSSLERVIDSIPFISLLGNKKDDKPADPAPTQDVQMVPPCPQVYLPVPQSNIHDVAKYSSSASRYGIQWVKKPFPDSSKK
ncbi:MAG TPA: hypothetical protein VJB87_01515 [Candidatus Nanoarchaeia archaeon]|nr:hypothetical protein [Candidatus Nanoarchaeia archaeon]